MSQLESFGTFLAILAIAGSIIGGFWSLARFARKLVEEVKQWVVHVVKSETKPIAVILCEHTKKIDKIDRHLETLNGSVVKLQEADQDHSLKAEYLRGRIDEKAGTPL